MQIPYYLGSCLTFSFNSTCDAKAMKKPAKSLATFINRSPQPLIHLFIDILQGTDFVCTVIHVTTCFS